MGSLDFKVHWLAELRSMRRVVEVSRLNWCEQAIRAGQTPRGCRSRCASNTRSIIISSVGSGPSRYDLSAGRREYAAAVKRLQEAIIRFEAAGVPLTTELGRMMQLWNREQVGAVIEIRDAWSDLVETRRAYERLLRDDVG